MQLLHNFERFGIKYFGGIVLKHRQEEFEIIVEIDVCAAVNVVLDLIGSLLQIDSLFLLHPFHANAIELCVIHHFSFHAFVIQELQKLCPGDLV